MKKLVCIILALTLTVFLCSCSYQNESKSNKIKIVASNFAAYDFARAVSGENAELIMLIPPATETHGFEPTVADIKAVTECDVFIHTGGESDTWVQTILSCAKNTSMKTIAMTHCVDELCSEEHNHEDEHQHNHHSHKTDEHVWTSPKNAISIVEHIESILCGLDKENADTYRANADNYTEKLLKLDESFRSIAENGKRKTLVFGDRYPLLYFSKEYSLTYEAAFSGCSEDTEASASTIARLIDKVRGEDIPVVFALELSNASIAKQIAKESGARVLTFYSCHNVSKEDFESGKTYVDIMSRNLESLNMALN